MQYDKGRHTKDSTHHMNIPFIDNVGSTYMFNLFYSATDFNFFLGYLGSCLVDSGIQLSTLSIVPVQPNEHHVLYFAYKHVTA